MVDTACATIAPGKAKAPTTSTDINILHCTFGHTYEVLLKKEQQGVNPRGKLHKCRGCPAAKGYGSPPPSRRTPEQIPSASPALPQQLPPIAKDGESTAGEGASGEGASNQGGGRMQGLDSELNLGNAAEV